MCIVIDTNALAKVFEVSCAEHQEFRPVLDWICNGKGKIVFGGKTYRKELPNKYLRIFRIFDAARKLVLVNASEVDDIEVDLYKKVQHRDFDDAHIIAIIIVSGCKLICSDDSRAYSFFKNRALYPNHFALPRIYSKSSNVNLLNDHYIVGNCRPSAKVKGLMELFE